VILWDISFVHNVFHLHYILFKDKGKRKEMKVYFKSRIFVNCFSD